MSAIDTVQAVPRILLTGYLRAVRLPVTALERVARQQDNEHWPPALVYEGFEAAVETAVGSLLRDETLLVKSQVRRAKLAQLRTSAELAVLAESEQERADQRQTERRREIAEQSAETVRRAEKGKQSVGRQAHREQDRVQQKAVEKTAASRRIKASQDKVRSGEQRAAKAGALQAESRALDAAEKALAAEDVIDVIDARIDAAKAARKADRAT